MANAVYNTFKKHISTIDWDDNATTTIKGALVTDVYTPDIDGHEFYSQISNEVTASTGYTAGGNDLINRLITVDHTVDLAKWDGDDITWSASTITARGIVIYKDTGLDTTSPLICYIDFGENKVSDSGDFIAQVHPDGIVKVS